MLEFDFIKRRFILIFVFFKEPFLSFSMIFV